MSAHKELNHWISSFQCSAYLNVWPQRIGSLFCHRYTLMVSLLYLNVWPQRIESLLWHGNLVFTLMVSLLYLKVWPQRIEYLLCHVFTLMVSLLDLHVWPTHTIESCLFLTPSLDNHALALCLRLPFCWCLTQRESNLSFSLMITSTEGAVAIQLSSQIST